MKPFIPDPKPETYRSEAYLDHIRGKMCLWCNQRGEPHHERMGKGGMSLKPPDSQAVPACRTHHNKRQKYEIDYSHMHLMIIGFIFEYTAKKRPKDNVPQMVIDFLTDYMRKEGI